MGFEGLQHVQCDQCQYGLVHPECRRPIRKRTQFVGQPKVVKSLTKKCPGRHQHAHIEDNVKIDELSVRLSTWCGAYPPDLCRAIIRGAEEFLSTRDENEEIYYEEVFAEEKMMPGDELVDSEGDWAAGRVSSGDEERPKRDDDDDLSDIEDETEEDVDLDFELASQPASSGGRPTKDKFKVAMKTILRAMEYDDDVAAKMKKAKEDMGINAREVLAVLPLLDKEEKKLIYQQLKAEQEEIAAQTLSKDRTPMEMAKRPHQRTGGYTSKSKAAPAGPSRAAGSDRSSRAAGSEEVVEGVPVIVKQKSLEEFRRMLYDSALDRRGRVQPSQAADIPAGDQVTCRHDFQDLRWGANG